MKKVLIILVVIVILGGVAVAVIAGKVKNFEAYIVNIDIHDVDLAQVPDGTYTGFSDSGVIKVEVKVEIHNHAITNIEILEHQNGQGQDAETIIEDMLEEQRINVDTIAGATYSSLVIQDAVQKALLY